MEGVVESICQARLAVEKLALGHSQSEKHIMKLCDAVHLDEMHPFQPLILTTFERLATSLWQDVNFAEKSSFVLDQITVHRIWESVQWQSLILKDGRRQTESCWLAGISKDRRATRLCDRLLASGLYLIDYLKCDTMTDGFLSNLEPYYENYGEVALRLLENDERCLGVLLILHKQRQAISETSVFEFRRLMLEVFRRINFDHLLIMEWLQSEVMASTLITRVVQDIIFGDNWKIWKRLTDNMNPPCTCSADSVPSWSEEEREEKEDDIVIEVFEKAGDKKCLRTSRFSQEEPHRFPLPPAPLPSIQWSNVIQMFSKLSVRLDSLGSGLLGFNPSNLCSRIEQLDQLMEEAENMGLLEKVID